MPTLFKRYVEIGRVVTLNFGKHKGKIAAIVSIGDHNRVLVHGPSVNVPRHEIRLRNAELTNIVIPREAIADKAAFETAFAAAVERWNNLASTKSKAAKAVRASLNDFDRFKRRAAAAKLRSKWEPKFRAARAQILKSANLEADLRRRFA